MNLGQFGNRLSSSQTQRRDRTETQRYGRGVQVRQHACRLFEGSLSPNPTWLLPPPKRACPAFVPAPSTELRGLKKKAALFGILRGALRSSGVVGRTRVQGLKSPRTHPIDPVKEPLKIPRRESDDWVPQI